MNNNYNGTTIKFTPVTKDGKPASTQTSGQAAVSHLKGLYI